MTNFAFLVLLLISLSSALSSAPVCASAEGVGGRPVVVGLFADAGEGGPALEGQLRGWTQVTLKDLRRWFRKAYFRFYVRPSYVRQAVAKGQLGFVLSPVKHAITNAIRGTVAR